MDRLRRPPTTVRWRLTLLYGGLFLVCGAALLAVTYSLAAQQSTVIEGPRAVFTKAPPRPALQIRSSAGAPLRLPPGARLNIKVAGKEVVLAPGQLSRHLVEALQSSVGRAVFRNFGAVQRGSDLHQLEVESGIALAIMAIISGLLGWIVAGRVLRPLRVITATTQKLSEANLHERLALAGPRDELRTLADTIDGLLERLERAFEAQRRFVTNASHELRTPLASSRALLEMAISDPEASLESLRAACLGALEEGEQQEQLIAALLTLTQGERGLERRDLVDLGRVAREEGSVYAAEAAAHGLELSIEAEPAAVSGDRRLLTRLVANLVQNAVRHNVANGYVRVEVTERDGAAALTVVNSGPRIAAEEVPRLLQPFQRQGQNRLAQQDGFGLGLSIIAAIAGAHDSVLEIEPGPDGGLRVELGFPPARPLAASDLTDHAGDSGPPGPPGGVADELQLELG